MTMVSEMRLTRWNKTEKADSQTLHEALQAEELSILEWTDRPGTIYPVHTHPFAEVRMVVSGRLRVGLPETGEEIILEAGDRIDVPGTPRRRVAITSSRDATPLQVDASRSRSPRKFKGLGNRCRAA